MMYLGSRLISEKKRQRRKNYSLNSEHNKLSSK